MSSLKATSADPDDSPSSSNKPSGQVEGNAQPWELVLPNVASEIPSVHEALDKFVCQRGFAKKDFARLHVALEEHLTNIVSYAYRPGQHGTIRVRLKLADGSLLVELADDGRPYNPLAAPEVDTALPLEDKPVGGLGVFLIRKNVDHLEYKRVENQNVLLLEKRLPHA